MASKKKPIGETFITIKIFTSSRQTLRLLQESLTINGWTYYGSDRTDPPSAAAVVDAALSAFAGRKTAR